jgi:hypothetical protein
MESAVLWMLVATASATVVDNPGLRRGIGLDVVALAGTPVQQVGFHQDLRTGPFTLELREHWRPTEMRGGLRLMLSDQVDLNSSRWAAGLALGPHAEAKLAQGLGDRQIGGVARASLSFRAADPFWIVGGVNGDMTWDRFDRTAGVTADLGLCVQPGRFPLWVRTTHDLLDTGRFAGLAAGVNLVY